MSIATLLRPQPLAWDSDAGLTYRVALNHFKLSAESAGQVRDYAVSLARSGQSTHVRPAHVYNALGWALGGLAMRSFGQALADAYASRPVAA